MLYCEGPSDRDSLPILIQRTAQYLLDQYADTIIEVLPVEVVEVAKQEHGKDILEAALKAFGRHILVVHKDADERTFEETRLKCFNPGESHIQKSAKQICKHVIPVIPVREMEAWMLADREKLRDVLEIKERLQNLGLPKRAVLVESIPDPKATLNKVIAIAEFERGRKFKGNDLHAIREALAQEIRLERLNQVPAYQYFVDDLKKALVELHMLPAT